MDKRDRPTTERSMVRGIDELEIDSRMDRGAPVTVGDEGRDRETSR